jgi:hypothetical protein
MKTILALIVLLPLSGIAGVVCSSREGKKIEITAKSHPSEAMDKSDIISEKDDRLYVVSEEANEEGLISISIIRKTEKPNFYKTLSLATGKVPLTLSDLENGEEIVCELKN